MLIQDEELFFVEYEKDHNKCLLYAPLRSYLALIKKSTRDDLISEVDTKIKQEIIGKLKQRRLINIREIHNLVKNLSPELTLAITDNCNLRCRYCHASAGSPNKRASMSFEMIDGILASYFEKVTTEKIRITFAGGGEPTFDFDKLSYTIKNAQKYAKEKNIGVHFMMASNGCFNETIREFVKSNFSGSHVKVVIMHLPVSTVRSYYNDE